MRSAVSSSPINIAFKNGGDKLALGSLRFKGAALGAWMEFCKTNSGAPVHQGN